MEQDYVSALVEVGLDATALQEGLAQLQGAQPALEAAGQDIIRAIERIGQQAAITGAEAGAKAGEALGHGIASGTLRALQSEMPAIARIIAQSTSAVTAVGSGGPADAALRALQSQQRQLESVYSRLQSTGAIRAPLALPAGTGQAVNPVDFTQQAQLRAQAEALARVGQLRGITLGSGRLVGGYSNEQPISSVQRGPSVISTGVARPLPGGPFPFQDAPSATQIPLLFQQILDRTQSVAANIREAGRGVPNQVSGKTGPGIPQTAIPGNYQDLSKLTDLRAMLNGLSKIAEQAADAPRATVELAHALDEDATSLRRLSQRVKAHQADIEASQAGLRGEQRPGPEEGSAFETFGEFQQRILREHGGNPFPGNSYRVPSSQIYDRTPKQDYETHFQALYERSGGDSDEAMRILEEDRAADARAQQQMREEARQQRRAAAGGGAAGGGGSGGGGGGNWTNTGGPAEEGGPGGFRPQWRAWEQHQATTGLRGQFLGGRPAFNESHPLDALFGGIENVAQYVKYFAALSGSIAIFDALSRSISDSIKQALQFQLATTKLAEALDVSDKSASNAAVAYGNVAAAAGQSPVTGVQTATIGVQRFGASGALPVTQQATQAAVLDPSGKAVDYASRISSIAQDYNVNVKDLSSITNDAYIAQKNFGAGINDTLQGVEQIAPVAKAAGAPLNDLIQTIGLLSARTGKSGTAVAQALRPILESAGNPTMIKALADAGINPTGSSYGNLQALASRFPSLNQPTQSAILRTVGGRSGALGAYLSDGGDISKAVTDAIDHPNASQDAFKRRMDDALNVAKQLGATLLDLGKDVASSGVLDGVGLIIKGLTPIAQIADRIVQTFNSVTGIFGQWAVGLGSAYAVLRLISTSSVGARLAGSFANPATGTASVGGVIAGSYVQSRNALFGGQYGLAGLAANTPAAVRAMQGEYDASVQAGLLANPAQAAYQSQRGFIGPLLPTAGGRPGLTNPATLRQIWQQSGGRLVGGGLIGAAGAIGAIESTDPLQAGLSAAFGASALGGPVAGAAVGLLVTGIKSLTEASKEAAAALASEKQTQEDYTKFLKSGQNTASATQNIIAELQKDASAQHHASHPGLFSQIFNGPDRVHPEHARERAAEAKDKQEIARLQAQLKQQTDAQAALQAGGTNAASIFGGFQLADATQTGVQALGTLGYSGQGQAQALLQALSGKGVAQGLLPSSIGDISGQLSGLATGVASSVTAQTGNSAQAAQASLAFAQSVLGKLRQSKNATPQNLQQANELVDQLTQTASQAINARVQALAGLSSSFLAQDDAIGRDVLAVAAAQKSLANDLPGSDQYIADATSLNNARQQTLQDQASKSAAALQAGVDPRNQVQGSAAQVQIASRALVNSTKGTGAFYQAQAALNQAQVNYANTVADAQATILTAGANPADRLDQLNRQIQADAIKLKALQAPLPKDPTGAGTGLALAAANPATSGVDAGIQFVQGIQSTDYKSVGNQVSADIVAGILGTTPTGTGSLPDLLGDGTQGNTAAIAERGIPGSGPQANTAAIAERGIVDPTDVYGKKLAQASAPIGYTDAQKQAFALGQQAAQAQVQADSRAATLQKAQLAQQAQVAQFGLNAAQSGGGAFATALAQVASGSSQAQFLRQQEPNDFQNDPAYIQALTDVANGVIALRQAIVDNTKNITLLSGDITDPRFTAAADASAAAQKLALDQAAGASPEVINADTVAARQAKAQSDETTFQTGLSLAGQQYQLGRDARFAKDAGAMSFSAYMDYLNSQRAHLLAIKNMTYQQQQDLISVDQAIQSATSTMQGQFNLGTIKVPSIYEVRRSAQTSAGGSGYSDNRTIAITINGANKAEVVQVLRDQLGTPAAAVRPTTPAKVRR